MYPIAQLLNAALDTRPGENRPTHGMDLVPRTDIYEGEADYRIVTDVPGVRNEDLDISLEDDVLTIKAARDREVPEGYTARRRELTGKVTFRRSFELGTAVDTDRISATLDDGVLTVVLPKSEKAVPRRIEVK
jgi:HSP20 family protein